MNNEQKLLTLEEWIELTRELYLKPKLKLFKFFGAFNSTCAVFAYDALDALDQIKQGYPCMNIADLEEVNIERGITIESSNIDVLDYYRN